MKNKNFLGDKNKLDKDIEVFIRNHRMRVLSKFIDKNFTNNEEFQNTVKRIMRGTIRVQIVDALDKEFSILRDDADDNDIEKLVNDKIENFIKDLYR